MQQKRVHPKASIYHQMALIFNQPVASPKPAIPALEQDQVRAQPQSPRTQQKQVHVNAVSRPLAVPIRDACCYLGVGRTTVYELMASGKLTWQKIGARRVILFSSIENLLGLQHFS
jgi:excisionase family DNA binding protein